MLRVKRCSSHRNQKLPNYEVPASAFDLPHLTAVPPRSYICLAVVLEIMASSLMLGLRRPIQGQHARSPMAHDPRRPMCFATQQIRHRLHRGLLAMDASELISTSTLLCGIQAITTCRFLGETRGHVSRQILLVGMVVDPLC